ncbi:nickel/cobalt transporter [Halomonas sp. HL-93]|uniref:nickel/cobalt transporter n=1 Tax=Halomonas sp. HL-93 TaxID=1666906 RepID=UPI001E50E07F|nr:nickel/cobalt transporter [Halomonas sp. HL-93]
MLAVAVLGYVVWQGGLTSISYTLLGWQRELHRELTLTLTALSEQSAIATWTALLGVSFGYGVFHAAGPGHGKAVLATFLMSHGGAVGRALGLSFAAALLQGVTAIALVAILVYGLGWVTRQAMGSVVWVEYASFLLVAALGAWLCWRAIGQLRRAYAVNDHDHDHACCGGHHISPQQSLDWRTALMTVGAIGMRPCSGAVLMLGAAGLLGKFAVGVAAVAAMSLGTGLTVSMLALASVVARGWAQRRLARQGATQRRAQRAAGWAALAGGLIIVVLGISLWAAGAAQPLGDPMLGEPPAQSGNPLTGD